MIDKKTGKVSIVSTTLFPLMPIEVFYDSSLKQMILSEENINGYTNIYISPQQLDNGIFIVRLYFDSQSKLYMVSLYRVESRGIPSMLEYSEEKELQYKSLNDKWLLEILGRPPYRYKWGDVTSQYSAQSISSSITIKYSKASL